MSVNHRRSGKDKNAWNTMAEQAWRRVGTYFYLFPTYAQARKVIWQGMDESGFKFLDHIPPQIRDGKPLDDDMLIKLSNGSIIQLIGTDNVDRIMGTNPVGCVFSEYALQSPQAWEFLEPILIANGGWAWFVFTPRGHNHANELFEAAKVDDDWYVERLTVNDTAREDGTRIVSDDAIAKLRARGVPEEFIRQEFYCDFTAGMQGAYYARLIEEAEKEKRITKDVVWDNQLPVYSIWDLGIADATAIWFAQVVSPTEFRFIDYIEMRGENLSYYIKRAFERPYTYKAHFAPHDIRVRELSTGASRYEAAIKLGVDFQIVPNIPISDGIDKARHMLKNSWFNAETCKQGVKALKHYYKEFDHSRNEYKSRPVHDWASHGADAFRYAAIALMQNSQRKNLNYVTVDNNFDVWRS